MEVCNDSVSSAGEVWARSLFMRRGPETYKSRQARMMTVSATRLGYQLESDLSWRLTNTACPHLLQV